MKIIDRADLSPQRLTAISDQLMGLNQLYRVLDWFQQRQSISAVPVVINQDEYSLDVIFDRYEDLYLVFGTT